MIRTFLTYLPLWMPLQSRGHLLWRQVTSTLAQSWFHLITNTSTNQWCAAPGSEDEKYDRANFIYAYARDSKDNAFAVDRLGWQLVWAHSMGDMLKQQIQASNLLRADSRSIQSLTGLQLQVTGIHRADRKLRFQWVEVLCSVDISLLFDWMSTCYDLVEKVYQKRWADDRYVFATPQTCPLPRSVEDLCTMDQFNMGLMLDVMLYRSICRGCWQRSRNCSYWNIKQTKELSGSTPTEKRIVEALQLKPALKQNALDGPYTGRIQALAAEAIDNYQALAPMRYSRYYFIYSRLSSTIIEKMDQLVEEMSNEAQHQRQQGPVCESAKSPDGTDSNQVGDNRGAGTAG